MSLFLKDGSFVNKFLFPAPLPTYTPESMGPDLIWVPDSSTQPAFVDVDRNQTSGRRRRSNSRSRHEAVGETKLYTAEEPTLQPTNRTPCLFLRRPHAEVLMIFFHGNGEDLGGSREFLHDLVYVLWPTVRLNVLAPEYPGYGCHDGQANESGVLRVAKDAYAFARYTLNFPVENIWLFGVSIGTGPAVHLASKYESGGLLLLAAYESIRAIARHLLGKVASYLIANRFSNRQLITQVECPAIFLHGCEDRLIPCEHSIRLFEACSSDHKQLVLADGVGHNEFDLLDDIALPIQAFVTRIRETRRRIGVEIEVPDLAWNVLTDMDCLRPPEAQARRLCRRKTPSRWRRISGFLKSSSSGSRSRSNHVPGSSAADTMEASSQRSGSRLESLDRAAQDHVAMLVAMGYSQGAATEAMIMAQGEFDNALDILLAPQQDPFP